MSFRPREGSTVPRGVVDKRDAILRAAGKVFAERGYHATGISDIAQELGAGHGTFYRYFKNKEDIARSVVSRALGQVMDALSDEDPGSCETLPQYRQQVRRIGHKLFDLVAAEPALCHILFYDAITIDRAEPDLVEAGPWKRRRSTPLPSSATGRTAASCAETWTRTWWGSRSTE